MLDQQLKLNLIPFNHPAQSADFTFSLEKKEDHFPIYKTAWPKNINEIFPDLPERTKFIYVNYSPIPEDQKFTINLHENPNFAKLYYHWLINRYFKEVSCISKSNSITDNEFWFYNKQASSGKFYVFRRFVLKVLIKNIVDSPVLLISYEGTGKVFKEALNKLNIPIEAIKKVIYDRRLIPYKFLTDEAKLNLSKVRPVLTNSICQAMDMKWIPDKPPNRLKSYHDEISSFVKTHINIPSFKKIIPISSPEFLQVPEENIFKTSNNSNLLYFGQNNTHLNPFSGILKNGPFKPTPHNFIEFILIFHQSDLSTAVKLLDWINGKADPTVRSLKDFLKMNFYLDIKKSIVFTNLDDPVPEIEKQLESWPRKDGTKYLGIYITPHTKENTDANISNLYYKVKSKLFKHFITSQAIESETINNSSFRYCLPNIAVSILAKLDGIPWSVIFPETNDLILGLGIFRLYDPIRFIGSAVCFNDHGCFLSFKCFSAKTTTLLAQLIPEKIMKFILQNPSADRLIIHLHTPIKTKDIKPIVEVLTSLNLPIPVIIISITKTNSRQMALFDSTCPSGKMLPDNGTFVRITPSQYLLSINARTGDTISGNKDQSSSFLKLQIISSDKKLLLSTQSITLLMDQLHCLSHTYYRSVTPQPTPVTIKYPEILSYIYPNYETENLYEFCNDNLWFL